MICYSFANLPVCLDIKLINPCWRHLFRHICISSALILTTFTCWIDFSYSFCEKCIIHWDQQLFIMFKLLVTIIFHFVLAESSMMSEQFRLPIYFTWLGSADSLHFWWCFKLGLSTHRYYQEVASLKISYGVIWTFGLMFGMLILYPLETLNICVFVCVRQRESAWWLLIILGGKQFRGNYMCRCASLRWLE